MNSLNDYEIFTSHKDSLRNISKDSENNEEVTTSTKIGISFDDVKTEYANKLNLSQEVAASSDSLVLFDDGTIAFIEFKNGKVKTSNIKNKIRDSLLIFNDIVKENISYTRENIEFIVVYNEEKNRVPNQYLKGINNDKSSRQFISKKLLQLGGDEIILFDIEKYKHLYFKNVHTYTKEEFEIIEKRIVSLE